MNCIIHAGSCMCPSFPHDARCGFSSSIHNPRWPHSSWYYVYPLIFLKIRIEYLEGNTDSIHPVSTHFPCRSFRRVASNSMDLLVLLICTLTSLTLWDQKMSRLKPFDTVARPTPRNFGWIALRRNARCNRQVEYSTMHKPGMEGIQHKASLEQL